MFVLHFSRKVSHSFTGGSVYLNAELRHARIALAFTCHFALGSANSDGVTA
jgi:hypothetical protein